MPAGKSYPLSVILTAIDRVSGPVQRVHDRIARLTEPLRPVQNALSSLQKTAGIDRLSKAFGGVRESASEVGRAAETSFRRVTYAIGLATGAAYLFNRQFIGTASTFENLEIQLQGIEGTVEKAKAAMAFVRKMTVETPFEMEDVAKTFRIMRGFGMDPAGGALQAIVDQVSKLGGSGEQLTGIALQMGQAFSKGRLQAQDANILVENGVPVWQLLQRAIARVNHGQQVSIGQLREWSEDGKLGVKSITLLIEQMGLESQGASKRMMTTWSGMISNLLDQWTFFKQKVMASGPFDVLKARVAGVLDRISQMAQSGELDAIAERWGARLVALFTWIDQRGVPMAVTAFRTVGRWLQWAADLTGGWENLLKIGLGAFIGGPLLLAIGGLIASIVSLGVAIGLTPIGWLIIGLTALAMVAVTVKNQWGPVSRWFIDIFKGWRTAMSGLLTFLEGIFTADLGKILSGLTNMFKGAAEFWLAILRPVLSALGWIADKVLPSGTSNAGPPLPRELPQNLRSLGLGGSSSQARVNVDFANVPRGTRITADPKSTALLELSRGFAMMESH